MKKIKIASVLLMLAAVMLLFAACGNPIKEIHFTETDVKVRLEDTYQIEYTLVPADIENPEIIWASSNEAVATVNETGLVTTVAEGEAAITATAKKDVVATLNITVGPKFTYETEEIKIDGLYVDKSYVDSDNSSNRLLYMYYTVKAPKSNVNIDSHSTVLTIDGTNKYTSKRITTHAEADQFSKSYYFSNYSKTVNVGEEFKVLETFLIPSAELEKGKTITVSESKFKSETELLIDTDSIVFCKDGKELAKKADPKGYKEEMAKRKTASEERAEQVRNLINGHYYIFGIGNLTYRIEFSSPSHFDITSGIVGSYISNEGTYDVREGYIYMNYDGMDEKDIRKIPYELKDGDIDLDISAAYDYNE